MPYICLRRADIPNGILQVTDLWPNKSQMASAISPKPQGPRYVNAPQNDLPVLTSTGGDQRQFAASCAGLAAYLLANVESGGAVGAACLTAAQAKSMADAIIAAMRTGAALELANINALLAGVVAASELTSLGGSASTGTVADVLRILAGAFYTVPAGTVVQSAVPDFTPQADPVAFNAANFDSDKFVDVVPMDSSFYISLQQGALNAFTASTFSYKGSTGAALVVYNDTGAVL